MSSKILQLTVGSRDLSQVEKKILLLQAKLSKFTKFTQNGPRRKTVVILSENSCHFVS